ncbi:MOSC domain-containing protein [Sporosarcina sp. D27]|uniref:MOSC domain-containing protein n=1 Tax=Sporosarcina sp. D27 TaxID=1382305 RepID=UPI00046FAB36|nr:MOSC domain-containing protein [Sporosarcina sp. D27]
MQLVTLSTSLPKQISTSKGKELVTGICKETIQEAFLSVDGFKGDDVADKKHHGGPDRAVCMYPHEHYAKWNDEFECVLPPAAFGENITAVGMTEAEVCIGDIFTLGDAIIQVTQGRIPCNTIDQRLGHPMMKNMIQTGFTGYLCRVLKEGMVRSEDQISLHKSDTHGVTVLEANTIYFHDTKNIEGIRRVLAIDALAEDWRDKFGKRLEKALVNS